MLLVNRLVKRVLRLLSSVVSIAMLIGLSYVAAPSAQAVSASAQKSLIARLVAPAQSAQRTYGVPASVSIAQAIVNTNWATTGLAKKAKNYYGTRCSAALTAKQFATLAKKQVGKAYVLGAEAAISNDNPKAFDCSELVEWLYGRSGNPITDLAAAQYDATKKVTGTPKPGDLVFLRNNPARANGIGHVAVVTKKSGNDWEIIEARGRKYGVVKTTLSYWKSRSYYAGLRRYSKLNFAGTNGVLLSTTISTYQSGCLSTTAKGKTIKYRSYTSTAKSVYDHAEAVATGSGYASARNAIGNVSSFITAIAKAERPSSATSYAKSLRSVISAHNLTQYDVVPLTTVLLKGKSGTKVAALQNLLNANGAKIKVSAKYDSATISAVKAFQKKKKLTADGEAGPKTLSALMMTLAKGAAGTRVTALKQLLWMAGYTTSASSTFDSGTDSALKKFQSRVGISSSGRTDVKTWSKLFMLIDKAPAPVVAGTTTVGGQLSATAGTWGPGKVNVSYQWYRGTSAIAKANSSRYVLQAADAGKSIKVITTGSKAPYTPVSRASRATAAVTPARLTGTPTPQISGTANAGLVLTARAGTWAPGPVSVKYQWYRNNRAIAGATGSSYRLQGADYNATLRVVTTGSKYGYYTTSRSSAITAKVKQGKLVTTPSPTITGKVAVGQTLSAKTGQWLPAPGALSYRWYRDKTAITGATKATYRVQAADAGHTIKVRAINTSAAYKAVARYSNATATVAKLKWSTTPKVTISGVAKYGKTLTVKVGTWSATPKLSYQWYRGSTAIKGATKASHKVTRSDRGKTLTIKVTATRTGYVSVVKKVTTAKIR